MADFPDFLTFGRFSKYCLKKKLLIAVETEEKHPNEMCKVLDPYGYLSVFLNV